MLNYNKIKSSMNSGDSKNSELIRFIGINQSTFYDKLKRESFTPNEVEKIAEFFKKPIAYYFDKEEPAQTLPSNLPFLTPVTGPTEYAVVSECKGCAAKQREIDALRDALEAKEELLQMYRDKKEKCSKNSA